MAACSLVSVHGRDTRAAFHCVIRSTRTTALTGSALRSDTACAYSAADRQAEAWRVMVSSAQVCATGQEVQVGAQPGVLMHTEMTSEEAKRQGEFGVHARDAADDSVR